jgi:hypothetical protein
VKWNANIFLCIYSSLDTIPALAKGEALQQDFDTHAILGVGGSSNRGVAEMRLRSPEGFFISCIALIGLAMTSPAWFPAAIAHDWAATGTAAVNGIKSAWDTIMR